MLRGKGVPVGRIMGIPIKLDYSWFLVVALATWSLATGYFPSQYAGWPAAQYWATGALTSLLLFASVLLHELGHATAANAFHIPTKEITLFIFGGVAHLSGEPRSAWGEFVIAIAGPLVSLLLAGVFFVLGPLGGFFDLWSALEPVEALFRYLAVINFALVTFNLIPGFPLDGGRVLRAIVWRISGSMSTATRIAGNVGRVIAVGFIAVGFWQMWNGGFADGVWLAFIGWFLNNAARSQLWAQSVRDRLINHTVGQAMSRDYLTVPAETSLQALADRYTFYAGPHRFFVIRDDHCVGIVTLDHLRGVERSLWPLKTASDVMTPVTEMELVAPETGLWSALEHMDRDGVNQLPVMADGTLIGMLTRADVQGFMQISRRMGVTQP